MTLRGSGRCLRWNLSLPLHRWRARWRWFRVRERGGVIATNVRAPGDAVELLEDVADRAVLDVFHQLEPADHVLAGAEVG
jgi:hypothetical protein